MSEIYINSIDEFLAFFKVKYDRELPTPTSSLHTHERAVFTEPPAMLIDQEHFPQIPKCKREIFRVDRIVYNDKQLLMWRKVK